MKYTHAQFQYSKKPTFELIKMEYELNKSDLISLVKGSSPYYSVMDDNLIRNCGQYYDNKGWSWNEHKLNQLTERQLWRIYQTCKSSWS